MYHSTSLKHLCDGGKITIPKQSAMHRPIYFYSLQRPFLKTTGPTFPCRYTRLGLPSSKLILDSVGISLVISKPAASSSRSNSDSRRSSPLSKLIMIMSAITPKFGTLGSPITHSPIKRRLSGRADLPIFLRIEIHASSFQSCNTRLTRSVSKGFTLRDTFLGPSTETRQSHVVDGLFYARKAPIQKPCQVELMIYILSPI